MSETEQNSKEFSVKGKVVVCGNNHDRIKEVATPFLFGTHLNNFIFNTINIYVRRMANLFGKIKK